MHPCINDVAWQQVKGRFLEFQRGVTEIWGLIPNRPNRLTQCCTQFKSPGVKIFVCCICIRMWHSHLNDMEIPETNVLFPKGLNWVQH